MRTSRAWMALGFVGMIGVASCNAVLGLGSFKNECGGSVDETCAPGSGGSATTSTTNTTGPGQEVCAPGTLHDCYSGPAGTEMKGVCHGGTQTCNMDGTGYSTCNGEKTPAAKDDCSNDLDDDCNGTVNDGCSCMPGDKLDCYSGPADTEDKGICHGGKKTCNAEGSGYGACIGEQLPAAHEDCSNALDDDCNGMVNDTCPCTPNMMTTCYDGPAATEGVGDCHAGMQTCKPDGSGYGACTGEALPATEDYDVIGDENCDGSPTSDVLWANAYGDSATQYTTAVAVDTSGNVYITGALSGSMQIGSTVLISGGGGSLFLAKLNSAGVPQWAKSFDNAGAGSVAVDSNGNVVIVGPANATIFGTTSVAAGTYVAEFAPDGTLKWVKSCAGAYPGSSAFVATDASNNVLVSTTYQTSVNCGAGSKAGFGAEPSFLVAQFTEFGTNAWEVTAGDSTQAQSAGPIATDPAGNVWVTGGAAGTVNYGGGNRNAGTSSKVLLLKLTSGGGHVSSNLFGVSGASSGLGLAVDTLGGPLLAAFNGGTINFGDGVQHMESTVLAKFNSGAGLTWTHGVNVFDQLVGVGLNAQNEGYLAGWFSSQLDLGGGPMNPVGNSDGFLWHFDAGGNHIYQKQYPGSAGASVLLRTLAVNQTTGDVVTGGNLRNGSGTFTSIMLTSQGSDDALVFQVAH